MSNQHCQQLGLVTINEKQTFPTNPTEHPGSFRSLINNLSANWLEPENLGKTEHVCSVREDPDLNELSSIASEHESKSDYTKDLPRAIKKIVVENLKVFMSHLDPSDHIDLAKILGYGG